MHEYAHRAKFCQRELREGALPSTPFEHVQGEEETGGVLCWLSLDKQGRPMS